MNRELIVCVGFPKCGTTALHVNLAQHRDVHVMEADQWPMEEMYFFSNNFDLGLDWYESKMQKEKINFEKTPSYIYDLVALERLKATYPNALIVVCWRPITRFYFSYYQMLFRHKIFCGTLIEFCESKYRDHACFAKHLRNLFAVFKKHDVVLLPCEEVKKWSSTDICNALRLPLQDFNTILLDPQPEPNAEQMHTIETFLKREIVDFEEFMSNFQSNF